jgi:hypothetical protein
LRIEVEMQKLREVEVKSPFLSKWSHSTCQLVVLKTSMVDFIWAYSPISLLITIVQWGTTLCSWVLDLGFQVHGAAYLRFFTWGVYWIQTYLINPLPTSPPPPMVHVYSFIYEAIFGAPRVIFQWLCPIEKEKSEHIYRKHLLSLHLLVLHRYYWRNFTLRI